MHQEPKLLELIEKERIYKNIYEIELMREAYRISSLIHNKIIYNREMFKKKILLIILNIILMK